MDTESNRRGSNIELGEPRSVVPDLRLSVLARSDPDFGVGEQCSFDGRACRHERSGDRDRVGMRGVIMFLSCRFTRVNDCVKHPCGHCLFDALRDVTRAKQPRLTDMDVDGLFSDKTRNATRAVQKTAQGLTRRLNWTIEGWHKTRALRARLGMQVRHGHE